MKTWLLLLKLNLTNLFAGLRGGSFRKVNGKLDLSRIIILVTAVVGIGVLGVSLVWLEGMLYDVMASIGMERLLLGLVVLLSMVTTLIFGVVHTLAAMYFNRDSVCLAHLPVSSRAVMAAKWTEIYLPEIFLSAVFLLPLSVMYGLQHGLGLLFYLRIVGLIITVPLYPLAIALLLSSLLGRMTSFTRNKEIWVVIGTVLMLVVVIGGEWLLLPSIPEDADAMFFLRLLMNNEALLQMLIGGFPPVMWAVRALEGSWTLLAVFMALGILAMAAVLFLAGGDYLAVCLRHTEQGVRRKRGSARGKLSFKPRSPLMAIFWREMNEALKTPVYLLNGVLGTLMMPIIMGGALVGVLSSSEAQNVMGKVDELLSLIPGTDLMLIMAALFSFNSWIMPVISTSVSREGKRLQVTRMIPVPARTILNAKLLGNIAISGAGTLIVAVALVFVLGVGYLPHVFGAFVLAMLLTYAASVANLAIDTSRPTLNWKNETQVMKQNMNQMIGMLLSTVMMALVIAPPFFLLKASPVWRTAVVLAVLAVECIASHLLMRGFVVKRYQALEP